MADEIDEIIAKALGFIIDSADCPPDCEGCRRERVTAAPKIAKLRKALSEAGYRIEPDPGYLLERGEEAVKGWQVHD